MTDTDTDTPPIPTDGDEPDSTCVKPNLTAVSLGSAVQLRLRLDSDSGDHDGDDEQGYNPGDDEPERSLTRSHSHSPVPRVPTPPAQQQQQQQQQAPQPAPTTTSPFAAHVHFHSRVRITSGLRHSRGNRTVGDSSDSDSPSSSISAPLRYHSRSTGPRLPLSERISRLAAQALQKRRMAAASSTTASSTASRRFQTRDHEYTPFSRTGVPVTYGTAAQHGYSGVANDADSENGNPSQLDYLHGEDGIAFRRWPWRVLNSQVSSACGFFLFRDAQFTVINPPSGGSGRSNQLCAAAVLMSPITTNDPSVQKYLFVLHCPHRLLCYSIVMYLYLSIGVTSITRTCRIPLSHTRVSMTTLYSRTGRIIVGGKVVTGGRSDVANFLAFWTSNSSMTTSAAIASTMGTARGTTQGSCRPRATSVPGVPSY